MNILEVWRIVKIAAVVIALIALVIAFIQQGITGEWFGLSEQVRYPWAKEERKKAKAEEKRKRNKKWYEN